LESGAAVFGAGIERSNADGSAVVTAASVRNRCEAVPANGAGAAGAVASAPAWRLRTVTLLWLAAASAIARRCSTVFDEALVLDSISEAVVRDGAGGIALVVSATLAVAIGAGAGPGVGEGNAGAATTSRLASNCNAGCTSGLDVSRFNSAVAPTSSGTRSHHIKPTTDATMTLAKPVAKAGCDKANQA
jgi:hypothetical protein